MIKNHDETSADTVKPARRLGRWQHSIIVGCSILALVLSAYALYENYRQRRIVETRQNESSPILNALRQKETLLNQNLDNATRKFQELQSQTQQQLRQMNKKLQSVLQERYYQKQDWLLLKARYFLESAQINLHWSDNPEAGIALLQQADDVLKDLSDAQLFPVRQAIAKESAQLKTIQVLDKAGLLSKLDSTQLMIASLPLRQTSVHTAVESAGPESGKASWKDRLIENFSHLQKLVVIKKHEENFDPVVSSLHQSLLRETLVMNIQQAQWAVLQNNNQIYQQSLSQALKNIVRIFDENAADTKILVQQIQGMQQIPLGIKASFDGESLNLLNRFIESKSLPLLSKDEKEL